MSIFGSVLLLLTVWFGAEAGLALRARWRFPPRMLLALPVRDMALPFLWLAAWAGTSFVWRGTTMEAQRRSEAA